MEQPALFETDPTLQVLKDNASRFRDGFVLWYLDNRHIWKAFCDEANKMRKAGAASYSARMIVYVLRHNSTLADSGNPWKINDHCSPDLGRLYMLTHADARDFF